MRRVTRYRLTIRKTSARRSRSASTVSVSQATVTGLPAQRLFWRVRAFNSAGVAGPFSTSRRFTAQAASTPSAASLSAVSVSSDFCRRRKHGTGYGHIDGRSAERRSRSESEQREHVGRLRAFKRHRGGGQPRVRPSASTPRPSPRTPASRSPQLTAA